MQCPKCQHVRTGMHCKWCGHIYDHYNAPAYQTARKLFLQVHQSQIAKGAAKYPEPLNPASWTLEELVQHALEENVDQLHYLTAIKIWVEEMQNEARSKIETNTHCVECQKRITHGDRS